MNLAQHHSTRFAASMILGLLLAVLSPTGNAQRYSFQTIAGGHDGDGGAALDATVQRPSGVAFDAQGNLFVSDAGRHRIRKVTPAGTITTVVGTGIAGYSGDGGSDPANSRVHGPSGLAFDAAGNLYFADSSNNRIRRLGTDGSLTVVAGNGSTGPFFGDGGPAVEAPLASPQSLAFDQAGNLYVSQTSHHRIRKITPGGIITTFAGTGIPSGPSTDGGPAINAAVGNPRGLAVDGAGNLLIAQSPGDRIRSVSPAGIISTVRSGITFPWGLLFDAAGNLYVSGNCVIYRVDTQGKLAEFAGTEWPATSCTYSGDGGPATSAGLYQPEGMALAADGSLWFADPGHARVRRVAAGIITTVVGRGSPYGDGGPAASADFSSITGIGIGANGEVLVADAFANQRVRAISDAGIVTTLAGKGEPYDFSDENGGPAIAANLDYPFDVAADAAGNTYFTELLTGRIRRVTPGGMIELVANGLVRPQGLALDAAGNLYVADQSLRKVFKLSAAGQLTVFAGGGINGALGDGGPATAASVFPLSVATDGFGNVYIGESTRRVRKVSPDGIIRTVAGNGEFGFSGNNGLARSAAIGAPTGIAVAPNGDLFIASGALRKVSKGGLITTLYELEYPAYDVAIGSDGKLYVASVGGRVLEGSRIAPPAGPLPDKRK